MQEADEEDPEGDKDSDSESDKSEDENLNNVVDANSAEDFWINLGFQEKGLRNYFRPADTQELDKLRSSASSAYVVILETVQSILCAELDGPARQGDQVLKASAINSWRWCLRRIHQTELSNAETARAIEAVCGILSNAGSSVKKLESEYQPWMDDHVPCVLGETDTDVQETLDCIQTLAARAIKLPQSLISGATVSWIRPFARNPKAIFIKLADAHVTNWLASYGHTPDYEIQNSFLYAHYALSQGRDLPAVQQNEQLRSYFGREGLGVMKQQDISEDAFVTVSRAFLHIDMTAQSYLSVAVSMINRDMRESSLPQLDLALQNADTDLECMEIHMRITEATAELARSAKRYHDMIEESETPDEDPVVPELREKDGERKEDYDEKFKQWASKASEAITKAADIASALPETSMEDRKVREIVCSVWVYMANAEILVGNMANTVDYCKKALAACREQEYPSHMDLLRPLADSKNWPLLIEIVKVLQKGSKLGPWVYLDWYRDELHDAAKATGEIDYILELYRDAVPATGTLWEYDASLVIGWARFLRDVVRTDDATVKAKALLNRAIEAQGTTRYVAEASFRLSDILLEEFRHTNQPKDKMVAYKDMQDLVKKVEESMGAEFDPSQSQTVIPLAHMARRMNAVEFQQGLEKTFKSCFAALTDETGWNDRLSLSVLARVLALVGLQKEAEIAATCQIYILNIDVFKQENGLVSTLPNGGNAAGSETTDEKAAEEKPGQTGEEAGEGSSDEEDDSESGEAESDDEEAGEKKEAEASDVPPGSPKKDSDTGSNAGDPDSDIELSRDLTERSVCCTGCDVYFSGWTSDNPIYLCYYCTEIILCQKCFDLRAERIAGTPGEDWRVLCPEGHKHIRMPVEGWNGMKNGVFKIEEQEVSFQDWLVELKEKKWPETWEKFWSDEQ